MLFKIAKNVLFKKSVFGFGDMRTAIERSFRATMGDESDDIVRRAAIVLAIFGFLVHLSLWALHNSEELRY